MMKTDHIYDDENRPYMTENRPYIMKKILYNEKDLI